MDTEDGPGSRFGNYVTISTLKPEIEIYSINLLNSVYPDAVLGNPEETAAHVPEATGTGKKKRKKAKHCSASEAHHVDAILSLPWNHTVRQMLASGSADHTVKLWDLSRDPKEGASRSFGKTRCRPLVNFDAQMLASDLDQQSPASCALDVNAHIRGCLATAGTDKMVKIWNVQERKDGTKRQVSLVAGCDLGLGEVFSAVWSPDDPLTLAAAGSKVKLQIWDVGANFGARKVFGPRLAEAGRKLRDRTTGGVIGVADDEEDSDDKEE
ncbi:hypothetical protein EDB84DRAFT_1542367 [Lactarius hengduanensis]|nr:hypothetical protein EDB84DRAFT_1542367 [Lactarius hengduanensis]